jgi:hypothetical protein
MKVGAVLSATAVPQVGQTTRSPGISCEHDMHFIVMAAHFIRRGREEEGKSENRRRLPGAGKRKPCSLSFPGRLTPCACFYLPALTLNACNRYLLLASK